MRKHFIKIISIFIICSLVILPIKAWDDLGLWDDWDDWDEYSFWLDEVVVYGDYDDNDDWDYSDLINPYNYDDYYDDEDEYAYYDDYYDDYYDSSNNNSTNSSTDSDEYPETDKLPSHNLILNSFAKVAALDAGGVYKLIGGNAYQNYLSNPIGFANACAMRLSYAFNMASGFEIPFKSDKTISGDVNGDGIKEWYFFRVSDMVSYLNDTYGESHDTTTDQLEGQTGIIWQSDCGWGDASGHLDVWDGDSAVDHFYDTCEDVNFWKTR